MKEELREPMQLSKCLMITHKYMGSGMLLKFPSAYNIPDKLFLTVEDLLSIQTLSSQEQSPCPG